MNDRRFYVSRLTQWIETHQVTAFFIITFAISSGLGYTWILVVNKGIFLLAPLMPLDGPRLEVIADEWIGDRRKVTIRFTTSIHDRLNIFVLNPPLQAVTFPNDERIELPVYDGAGRLRFDGTPVDGIGIRFEFSATEVTRFLLLEETTGVPFSPGLETHPAPGTMLNPGGYDNLTDFTSIYRRIDLPAAGGE